MRPTEGERPLSPFREAQVTIEIAVTGASFPNNDASVLRMAVSIGNLSFVEALILRTSALSVPT
jgi:hypothetical protein